MSSVTQSRSNPGAAAVPVSKISREQWRVGVAAWLGWTLDGLDMHIYTLVAAPFVAQLLGGVSTRDERVGRYGSIIQAGFLLGWALGGGFFGRIGDRLGRARALSLSILTYAVFTGASFFAQAWWHLLILRFVSALGIGGEWAVGAALLSETWPSRWRPWIAATLQTGVNVGILLAAFANLLLATAPPRCLFLVGVLPGLLVFWIRRAVPEPAEWRAAKADAQGVQPRLGELFGASLRRVTGPVALVCAISLTAHWAFLFWVQQHLRNLPEVLRRTEADKNRLAAAAMYLIIGASIPGNYFAGWLARRIGYRAAIAGLFLAYSLVMLGAYITPRPLAALLYWMPAIGFCQGVFALFTMYLPPLFPTLLRTTGAGFCFNIGRVAAAFGTIIFGLFSKVGDHRSAIFYAGFLFLPASFLALWLPALRAADDTDAR